MTLGLLVIIGVLVLIIIQLLCRLYLMRQSMAEIEEELNEKLSTDTNTLISVSSSDPYIRKLAARLNEQLRALRKERRRLQYGDKELKEAVTNISHDLRTPLTAICGYLDLIDREEKSDRVSRYLCVIKERTEAMKALTDELFNYSVITSASKELQFEKVSLNGALEESLAAFYGVLTERGIVPEINMPETQIIRSLDRTALMRIFSNILNNSLKYSDGDLTVILSGEGKVSFSNTTSKLDGIQVDKLFDRFYTVETARNSTGLGLSISKLLTEQLGGEIYAEYAEKVFRIAVSFNQR